MANETGQGNKLSLSKIGPVDELSLNICLKIEQVANYHVFKRLPSHRDGSFKYYYSTKQLFYRQIIKPTKMP